MGTRPLQLRAVPATLAVLSLGPAPGPPHEPERVVTEIEVVQRLRRVTLSGELDTERGPVELAFSHEPSGERRFSLRVVDVRTGCVGDGGRWSGVRRVDRALVTSTLEAFDGYHAVLHDESFRVEDGVPVAHDPAPTDLSTLLSTGERGLTPPIVPDAWCSSESVDGFDPGTEEFQDAARAILASAEAYCWFLTESPPPASEVLHPASLFRAIEWDIEGAETLGHPVGGGWAETVFRIEGALDAPFRMARAAFDDLVDRDFVEDDVRIQGTVVVDVRPSFGDERASAVTLHLSLDYDVVLRANARIGELAPRLRCRLEGGLEATVVTSAP